MLYEAVAFLSGLVEGPVALALIHVVVFQQAVFHHQIQVPIQLRETESGFVHQLGLLDRRPSGF